MKKILVCALFFLISISMLSMELLNITKTQTVNLAIPITFFWIILIMLIQNKKVLPYKFIILIFIFLGISIFSLLYFQNIETIYILRAIKLNSFILFILFGLLILNEKNIQIFLKTLSLTFALFLLSLILQNPELINSLFRMQRLFEMNFLWFTLESGNLFISGLAFFLFIIIYNLKLNRNMFFAILTYITFGMAVFLILTSFVRTAYLMLFIIVIYFYFQEIKNTSKGIKFLLSLFAFIAVLFLIHYFSTTIFFERILYTFQSQNGSQALDDSSYARIILFIEIIKTLLSSTETFFLGTGFEEFNEFNIYNPFNLDSAHNGFFNMAIKTGVLYTALVIITSLLPLISKNKNLIIEKNFFIILITLFLITNLTGEGFNYFMINQPFFILLGVFYNEYFRFNWGGKYDE